MENVKSKFGSGGEEEEARSDEAEQKEEELGLYAAF